MRFSSTLIIALVSIHTLFGQIKVAQHVLSSGGSQAKTGKISSSGTLGETFIFGGKNANYFYCQGFQSGNEATITAVRYRNPGLTSKLLSQSQHDLFKSMGEKGSFQFFLVKKGSDL
jgi:hypothetical protein